MSDGETYGRGGGERFGEDEHGHGYASSGSVDWRRAMRAYVAGHDRGWEADRKYREAAEETPTDRPAREDSPERSEAPEVASREAPGTTGSTGPGTGFGVPVARRLDFRRAASTWRDRLPDRARLPRHSDRSGPERTTDEERRPGGEPGS